MTRAEVVHIDDQLKTIERLPLKVVILLIAQTAGIVWWAARLDARVEQLTNLVQEASRDRYYASEAVKDWGRQEVFNEYARKQFYENDNYHRTIEARLAKLENGRD